jgi:Na+/melibiose symporter-like transporter
MLDDINDLKKDVLEYIEVKLDLIRLHTSENLSRIFSNVATILVIGYLLFFIILFISLAAGYYTGSLLDSTELGFLCVAGFYTLLLVLFLTFRKQIVERPVIKAIVRLFFPKFEDDEKK